MNILDNFFDNSLFSWVRDVFYWLYNAFTTSGPEVRAIQLVVLLTTMIASFILTVVIFRYRGKNALDIAVLLREIAIFAAIAQSFMVLLFHLEPQVWRTGAYLFLGITVVLLIIFVIREQFTKKEEISKAIAAEILVAKLKQEQDLRDEEAAAKHIAAELIASNLVSANKLLEALRRESEQRHLKKVEEYNGS